MSGRTPEQVIEAATADFWMAAAHPFVPGEGAAVRAALHAAGYAVVPIPSVAFKGPNDTDASMLRAAAERAEGARYIVGGSNVGRAVGQVLRAVADAAAEES